MWSTVFLISLLSLADSGRAQVKACYAWDGSDSGNFPCDPEAEVRQFDVPHLLNLQKA